MIKRLYTAIVRAQFVIVPLLFFSCNRAETPDAIIFADSTATMLSYDHVMVHAGNGLKRFRMSAPEIRRYEYASEPYTEYPKGVRVLCFSDSSSQEIIADLVTDYAILWENTNTWEARGHIVGNNFKEKKKFETDVLFWDQNNGLIYNDHLTRVFDSGNWWYGYGFSTDDMFSRWRFNRSRGQMTIKNDPSDTMQYSSDTVQQSNESEISSEEEIIWE